MRILETSFLALALLGSGGLVLHGEPSLAERIEEKAPEFDAKLEKGQVLVAPNELRDLIYFAHFGLRILDLRAENEFHLFHLPRSQRVTQAQTRSESFIRALPKRTVFILISNGQRKALKAWRRMTTLGLEHGYVLRGGIHAWLANYGPKRLRPLRPGEDPETRRYEFPSALGARHLEAEPGPPHEEEKPKKPVVKPLGKVKRKAGGCG
ncbi:MAG: hypothetical protein CSA62_15330 [Planctomycetota bacterium]|nr:MAG: hypothetical protein CSA62_15330 [Planctomycetota bacterium]